MTRDDHANPSATPPATEIELFWRPGCPFCAMLERDIEQAGITVTRHNIWDDPQAAAIVRSVAGGNETVPTVRIGDRALVNPSLAELTALIRDVAPELLTRG